jgi:hypothetical protein
MNFLTNRRKNILKKIIFFTFIVLVFIIILSSLKFHSSSIISVDPRDKKNAWQILFSNFSDSWKKEKFNFFWKIITFQDPKWDLINLSHYLKGTFFFGSINFEDYPDLIYRLLQVSTFYIFFIFA